MPALNGLKIEVRNFAIGFYGGIGQYLSRCLTSLKPGVAGEDAVKFMLLMGLR